MCALLQLTTGRNQVPTYEFSGQIVYAQQALHRNRRAAVFDPRPFCSLLFDNLPSISPSEQSRDLQLIGHARLCAIFQRVQHSQGNASWRYGSPESVSLLTYVTCWLYDEITHHQGYSSI